MRILLVHKNWWHLGGVETHMFAVREVFEDMGHEVVPFAMADERSVASTTEGYFVSPVEFRGGGARDKARAAERAVYGRETVQNLGRLLDEHPVDAAHVLHGYHQLGPAFLRLLRRRGVPTVLSMHDYKLGCPSYRLFNDATGQVCTRCFDHRFDFLYAPVTTRCWNGSAAGGVFLSVEAVSSRLLGAYTRGPGAVMTVNELQTVGVERMGVPRERIHVVPHFAELSDEAAPVGGREGTVLYVGRLVPEKGVDILVRAVAEAGLRARIVGEGRLRDELEALAGALGAEVTFVGGLDRAGVAGEMRRASVLAVPSVWHEVWGLVINEAFDANLPVVGSDVGGMTDLLSEGRGVLVPPGDHARLGEELTALLADDHRRETMAGTARDWARTELTRGRFVDRLRAVWASVGVEL